MPPRQTYSLEDIKSMLIDRLDVVIDRYAPRASGSHITHGLYYTLNPGRADRSVGSFCVRMGGPKAGRWNDYATGEHGDVLDLIALSLGCDLSDAMREARSLLGLQSDRPEDVERRKRAAAQAAERRRRAEADDRAKRARRGKQAHAIWLSGSAALRGSPVDQYLRDARNIDLARLGRAPGVLRYVPDCFYAHTDPDTGEVIERHMPAMVAIVTDHRGRPVACHRTYLARDAAGRWVKAPVAQAKKVLGDYAGAAIHVWKGIGPRGGKPPGLRDAPAGTHVYIAEGIEDALSAVLLDPSIRVLAAISLSNLGAVRLPDTVSDVTLIADLDENETARRALDRAVAQHQGAGRRVRLFQNRWGGKDLNDALLSVQADQGNEQEEEGDPV